MLFANGLGLKFSLGETTKRFNDINCSGGALYLKDNQHQHSVEQRTTDEVSYLAEFEDISTIEESIIPDFFETLKTPTVGDEQKEPPLVNYLLKQQATMNYNNQESLTSNTADVYMDLSHFSEEKTVNAERRAMTDGTLLTPLVDSDSPVDQNLNPFMAMNSQHPHSVYSLNPTTTTAAATSIASPVTSATNTQVSEAYVCAPPNDICFSVPSTAVTNTMISTNTESSMSQHDPTSYLAASSNQQQDQATYHLDNNNAMVSHQQPQHQQQQQRMMMANSYELDPNANSQQLYSMPTSSTNELVPTSRNLNSSLVYAELKTRSLTTTESDIPTVISDHFYASSSRGSLAGGGVGASEISVPSPCPSTSSMTSCSTMDNKDFSRSGEDLEPRATSSRRKHGSESSKKSRITKKQKFDLLVREQRRLEEQNERFKRTVTNLQQETKHYREVLTKILSKPK